MLFLIDDFYRRVTSGISSALTIFMIQKPLAEIGGDAGIERTVSTKKYIYKIHKCIMHFDYAKSQKK